MNLVKLYTRHGALMIDTAQLAGTRTLLTIYNMRGKKLSDTAKTEQKRFDAGCGVHRANLFASLALAKADSDRILQSMLERGEK